MGTAVQKIHFVTIITVKSKCLYKIGQILRSILIGRVMFINHKKACKLHHNMLLQPSSQVGCDHMAPTSLVLTNKINVGDVLKSDS